MAPAKKKSKKKSKQKSAVKPPKNVVTATAPGGTAIIDLSNS